MQRRAVSVATTNPLLGGGDCTHNSSSTSRPDTTWRPCHPDKPPPRRTWAMRRLVLLLPRPSGWGPSSSSSSSRRFRSNDNDKDYDDDDKDGRRQQQRRQRRQDFLWIWMGVCGVLTLAAIGFGYRWRIRTDETKPSLLQRHRRAKEAPSSSSSSSSSHHHHDRDRITKKKTTHDHHKKDKKMQRQQRRRRRRQEDDDGELRSNQDKEEEDSDDDDDDDDDVPLKPLPFSSIYRIPEAMETLGDRSDEYATLRKLYDTELLPEHPQRSLDFVKRVTRPVPPSVLDAQHDYDIYHCPYDPPPNYPREWNLVHNVLNDWPADDTNIPTTSGIHQGLCVFDYDKEYDKALHYRQLELPFVVVNDPRVARAAERWHAPGYVEQMVGPNVLHRAEYNTNNHFLYHAPNAFGGQEEEEENEKDEEAERHLRSRRSRPALRDLQGRPAELQNKEAVPDALRMTFGDWLRKANVTADHASPQHEHWYFRLIGCGYMDPDGSCDDGSTEALFDELPFFQPRHLNNALYLGDPDEQIGIHCRFGMKGVIAENHYDPSRNAIAVLMGQRRYIMSHPQQCAHLALLPPGHDSARHSAVDYTNPDLVRYPEFARATANEVVLQAGQVLYLPTNWFHYIVSLELNYQCNTRSGESDHYWPPIQACGFD